MNIFYNNYTILRNFSNRCQIFAFRGAGLEPRMEHHLGKKSERTDLNTYLMATTWPHQQQQQQYQQQNHHQPTTATVINNSYINGTNGNGLGFDFGNGISTGRFSSVNNNNSNGLYAIAVPQPRAWTEHDDVFLKENWTYCVKMMLWSIHMPFVLSIHPRGNEII